VESKVNSLLVDGEIVCVETLSTMQSDRDEEGVTEGVELGEGGMRKKICLKVRGLKEGYGMEGGGGETGIGSR
jgi:hypothetical protein